jgi:hypothetical protein
MKTASWIILLIVGALTLLGGLVSLGRAYISAQDQIGTVSLTELLVGKPSMSRAASAVSRAALGTSNPKQRQRGSNMHRY